MSPMHLDNAAAMWYNRSTAIMDIVTTAKRLRTTSDIATLCRIVRIAASWYDGDIEKEDDMDHAEAARLHRIAATGTTADTEAAHAATIATWQTAADPIIGLRAIEWSKIAHGTRCARSASTRMGHEEAAKAHEEAAG